MKICRYLYYTFFYVILNSIKRIINLPWSLVKWLRKKKYIQEPQNRMYEYILALSPEYAQFSSQMQRGSGQKLQVSKATDSVTFTAYFWVLCHIAPAATLGTLTYPTSKPFHTEVCADISLVSRGCLFSSFSEGKHSVSTLASLFNQRFSSLHRCPCKSSLVEQ